MQRQAPPAYSEYIRPFQSNEHAQKCQLSSFGNLKVLSMPTENFKNRARITITIPYKSTQAQTHLKVHISDFNITNLSVLLKSAKLAFTRTQQACY